MIEVRWNQNLAALGVAGSSASSKPVSSGSFQTKLQAAVSAPADLEDIFSRAAQKYQVPENLLKAVAKVESNFQADAVSSAGATGIMQLMPSTAKGLGMTDSTDPEQNIMGGAKMLSQLLSQYDGDIKLTLAAYNAGAGNVAKYGGVPPFAETQAYVKKVMQYLDEDIAIPQTTASSSESSGVSSGTDLSGLLGTLAAGSNTAGNSAADLAAQVLFGETDKEYTYEDYQLFLDMYLSQIQLSIAEQWQQNDSDNTAQFWL